VNDLEPPAFLCSPTLLALKRDIESCEAFKGAVMMSGSGTSIYALTKKVCPGSAEAEKVREGVASVRANHESVRYFECNFVAKADNGECWYEF
jgi:4-diphosphocytidyl-2C-methyl-D-erythritol kinase